MVKLKIKNDSSTDEELIKLCKHELPYQTKSFEILIERYKNKVYQKTLRILKNKEDAEDVAQEIFLKVFTKLHSFKGESSFSTWLYSITTSTCLNVLDQKKRRPHWFAIGFSDLKESEKEDERMFTMLHARLENEELRAKIEMAFEKLPEQVTQILRLRFFEELEYQTIADKLGLKLSAVKMRIKRAKENFGIIYNDIE